MVGPGLSFVLPRELPVFFRGFLPLHRRVIMMKAGKQNR